ncbi:hypothetical protein Pelo_3870 [Pelomyxa schiedti]|nr:hypothetical protein Pelo_3870 [Pelomyxa schiedti]
MLLLGRNCGLPYYFLKDVALSLPIKTSLEKIALILWSPEKSKIRAKMLLASSSSLVKRILVGIGTQGEATDYSELDYACFIQHAFSPSDDIL